MRQIKKLLPALVLVFAAITAFAFRSAESKAYENLPCRWFIFDGSDPFDPGSYTAFIPTVQQPLPICPGDDEVLCSICAPIDEIYEFGTVSLLDDQPKVDVTNDISTFLTTKLTQSPLFDEVTVTADNDQIAVIFKED